MKQKCYRACNKHLGSSFCSLLNIADKFSFGQCFCFSHTELRQTFAEIKPIEARFCGKNIAFRNVEQMNSDFSISRPY